MKYRILSNGEEFIVQIRKFFIWFDIKTYYSTGCMESPVGSYTTHFKIEKEAEKYIKKEFGNSAIRKRYFKVI